MGVAVIRCWVFLFFVFPLLLHVNISGDVWGPNCLGSGKISLFFFFLVGQTCRWLNSGGFNVLLLGER